MAGGARQFAGIVIKTVTRGLRPDAHKERQLKAVHLEFEALYAPQGELHAFPRRNVKDPFDHAVDRGLCRMALAALGFRGLSGGLSFGFVSSALRFFLGFELAVDGRLIRRRLGLKKLRFFRGLRSIGIKHRLHRGGSAGRRLWRRCVRRRAHGSTARY